MGKETYETTLSAILLIRHNFIEGEDGYSVAFEHPYFLLRWQIVL